MDAAFRIDCDFAQETRTVPKELESKPRVIAYSASVEPEPFTKTASVEVPGVSGIRHFLVPAMGGPLGGSNITVFPDGRGVMTQIFDLGGTLNVFSRIGNCEVLD